MAGEPSDRQASQGSTHGGGSRGVSAAGVAKLLLAMVLLGGVVGLGLRYLRTPPAPAANDKAPEREQKREKQREAVDRASAGKPEGGGAQPERERALRDASARPGANAAAGAANVDVVPAEDQRAIALIAEAQAAIPKMAFDEARKACDQAAGLRASPATRQTLKDVADKTEQFELAVAHIKVSEFARAETTWVLDLRGGRRLRGMIANEKPEALTLVRIPEENPATLGRAQLTLPRTEIEKRHEVPLAERRKEFAALLERLERDSKLGPDSDASAYLDLVVLSRRLDMSAKCLGYLEAARAKVPGGSVGTFFRSLMIQRAIERATLLALAGKRLQCEDALKDLTVRTLPGYAPADEAVASFRSEVLAKIRDDFAPTLTLKVAADDGGATASARHLATQATSSQGADMEVAGVSGVSSTKPAANKLCQQANRLFEEAMACQGRARSLTGADCDKVLAQAAEKLSECIDVYGNALEMDPDNKAIDQQQTKASMVRYGILFKTARMGMR